MKRFAMMCVGMIVLAGLVSTGVVGCSSSKKPVAHTEPTPDHTSVAVAVAVAVAPAPQTQPLQYTQLGGLSTTVPGNIVTEMTGTSASTGGAVPNVGTGTLTASEGGTSFGIPQSAGQSGAGDVGGNPGVAGNVASGGTLQLPPPRPEQLEPAPMA